MTQNAAVTQKQVTHLNPAQLSQGELFALVILFSLPSPLRQEFDGKQFKTPQDFRTAMRTAIWKHLRNSSAPSVDKDPPHLGVLLRADGKAFTLGSPDVDTTATAFIFGYTRPPCPSSSNQSLIIAALANAGIPEPTMGHM